MQKKKKSKKSFFIEKISAITRENNDRVRKSQLPNDVFLCEKSNP